MDYIEIGEFLEHQGLSDEEIDTYFIEHHGVKGQRWGMRKSGNFNARDLSGKHKLGLVAGGLVGGFLANRLTMGTPFSSIAGATIGVVATHELLNKIGSKKVSEISN